MKSKAKRHTTLAIQEALDNLSHIANIDPKDPYRLGIVKDSKFVKADEDISSRVIEWLTPESAEEVVVLVQKTYLAVLIYLDELYEDPSTDWDNPKTRKGLQSTMVLVGEAASKLDKLLTEIEPNLRPHSVTLSKEYQDLQQFYLTKIQKKTAYPLEGQKDWEEEWKNEESMLQTETAIKDFETIRNDREYELFYMTNEEGISFFSPHLLRNIKIVMEYDEPLEEPYK